MSDSNLTVGRTFFIFLLKYTCAMIAPKYLFLERTNVVIVR